MNTKVQNNVPPTDESEFTPNIPAIGRTAVEYCKDHPTTSSLVTFGAGFGMGMLIASLIANSDSNRQSGLASQISQQVSQGLSGILPQFLTSVKK